MHDESALPLVVGAYAQAAAPGLDAKASALARLAATIALRGELPSYLSNVDAAIDGGADLDEITGVFLAIPPVMEKSPRARPPPNSKRPWPPIAPRSRERLRRVEASGRTGCLGSVRGQALIARSTSKPIADASLGAAATTRETPTTGATAKRTPTISSGEAPLLTGDFNGTHISMGGGVQRDIRRESSERSHLRVELARVVPP